MLQKNWMELIKPSKMDVNVQENDGKVGRLIAEPLERGFAYLVVRDDYPSDPTIIR